MEVGVDGSNYSSPPLVDREINAERENFKQAIKLIERSKTYY